MEFELMKDQLHGAYREAFEAVLAYGTVKDISKDVMTDRLTELYDILFTAQTEGKDARRVTGDDRERFCKDIFQDYTAWERIGGLLERIYTLAWVIFILGLMEMMASDGGWKAAVTDVLPYLLGIGGSVIWWMLGNFVLAPLMLKSKKLKPNTWNNITLVAAVVMFVGLVRLILKSSAPMWELPTLWLVVGAGAYIAAYWITRSVRRYRSYGTIRNVRRQMLKDSYYKSLSNARLEIITLKTWKKQYEKLAQRGKNDPEDFLRRLKRNAGIDDKVNKGLDLFIAAVYLYGLIRQAASGEEVSEMILYALFMGVWMFFIGRFIARMFRGGTAVRKKLLGQCEASGLTMPAFIEERLSADE